jgi:cell division protease FtsH
MDDKAGRRKKGVEYGRRRKQVHVYGRTVWKFLQNHKNSLLTCFMLLLLVVLVFGVFSQLQPPAPVTAVPVGETAADYSTFIQQINNGNVMAVSLRGNEVNALLLNPLSRTKGSVVQLASVPQQKLTADYAAWNRFLSAGTTTIASSTTATSFDPARIVYTRMPASSQDQLMSLLISKHVLVNTVPVSQPSVWITMLWRFLPVLLLIVGVLIFAAARNGSRSVRSIDDRVTHIGKSRARRFERVKEASSSMSDPKKPVATAKSGTLVKSGSARIVTETNVTFADVAGIDEVRSELQEIVQFLREPERFNRLGARIPRGALLVGPPGTGKTLLAKAVAGEASVPFFSMSASEFVEMFVGVGASRVRDLFNQARQVAPCVVFIDEIDAVGRKRSMRMTGNDERDQTLNQLLVELDGFDSRKAIVVLAATNRADILDKALLRPGRFDRRIAVSAPDRNGREAILRVHTRQTPLHEDVSLDRLARMTTGMTGADLANLVNEAALSAARLDMEAVPHDCFEDALARVQLGALRPLVMNEKERRIIAIHEGGHALVAHHLPEADRVNRVTILPRGQSLGVTQFTAEEDRYNYSREMLMSRIAVGLGGRLAEEITFGPNHITTGAENDLQVVTSLARRMVTRWGMSDQIGLVFADDQGEGDFSLNMRRVDPSLLPPQSHSLVADRHGQLKLNGAMPPSRHMFAMSASASRNGTGMMMNALIDAEVQRIINDGRARAYTLLTEHRDQLELLASTLMECEQLDRTQFERLLQD